MPVPVDPIVIILTAVVLWAFWAACVLRDKIALKAAGPGTPGATPNASPGPAPRLHCGLCGGPHDYDDCPLEEDVA